MIEDEKDVLVMIAENGEAWKMLFAHLT